MPPAPPDDPPIVNIHTDGSCLGNPGPGGYGVVLDYNGRRKQFSAGYALTTNNRMELLAAIVGLEALNRSCKVVLHSDSRYVVDAISKGWATRWRHNGWMRNKKDSAVNPDLWQRLLDACEQHSVEFRWVRGHSGNADNELCDQLARAAAESSDLLADPGYGIDH